MRSSALVSMTGHRSRVSWEWRMIDGAEGSRPRAPTVPVAAVKLVVPRLAGGYLHRPRLVEQLAISDYLVGEILSRLTDEVLDLLTAVSVCGHLTAPLAVLGEQVGGLGAVDGKARDVLAVRWAAGGFRRSPPGRPPC